MPIPSPARCFASAADLAACRALLRDGSRTFFAASLVLPGAVRHAATGLYAFCRVADDAVDQSADPSSALENLNDRLQQVYAGAPRDFAADRAFADVVFEYTIPRAFPQALLEGFAWDAANRRYETLTQLHAYAVRVAGVVGAMMAMVMGIRDELSIARACDLGVAMQLTNIARDVGEDARRGRLYLPMQWLDEAFVDARAWPRVPTFDAALASVIKRLLDEAETLYVRSESGLANLPASCRPGMYAARLLYAEIGHELVRRRLDSISQRAVVAWPRKAHILARALGAAAVRRAPETISGSLAEAEFVMTSLGAPEFASAIGSATTGGAARAAPVAERRTHTRRRISDRLLGVLDLFERLERREHSARAAL